MLSWFDLIKKGSEVLIEEFPSNEDFIDTKEKLKNLILINLKKSAEYLEFPIIQMHLLWLP